MPEPAAHSTVVERRRGDAYRARYDRITALVGLVLLLALGAYQLWDLRGAFTDFDRWWAFDPPTYFGDDYVALTLHAEQPERWPEHFRSINTGMAAKRLAGARSYEIVVPLHLPLLWDDDPEALATPDNPGLDDYFDSMDGGNRVVKMYEPALAEEIIGQWRRQDRIVELPWDVSYVTGDADRHETVVLHTDVERQVIYVVPAELSPVELP